MVDAKPVQVGAETPTVPRERTLMRVEQPPGLDEPMLWHGGEVLAATEAGSLRLRVADSGTRIPIANKQKRVVSPCCGLP